MELCQSFASASVMYAKMPRFDASLTNSGSGAWMSTITGQADSCTIFSIRLQGVIGARAKPDQGDVGPLPRGDRSDVVDVDLTRDHLVPEGGDDGCDEGQPISALVGDQHPEMLSIPIAHRFRRRRV